MRGSARLPLPQQTTPKQQQRQNTRRAGRPRLAARDMALVLLCHLPVPAPVILSISLCLSPYTERILGGMKSPSSMNRCKDQLIKYMWGKESPPDAQHWNQTDCILCSQRQRSSIWSAKTRLGADCGSDLQLLIAKSRLKLKKVGKTTRPFRYDLNQIPCDYTVEIMNRCKGLNLVDRLHEELWMKVHNVV